MPKPLHSETSKRPKDTELSTTIGDSEYQISFTLRGRSAKLGKVQKSLEVLSESSSRWNKLKLCYRMWSLLCSQTITVYRSTPNPSPEPSRNKPKPLETSSLGNSKTSESKASILPL